MPYSLDLRKRVLSFVSEGGSKSEAVRLFKISRDTLYRWLNAEDLKPKKHGFRNRKLDKQALRKHVEEHPDMLLHERAEGLRTFPKGPPPKLTYQALDPIRPCEDVNSPSPYL